MPPCEPLTTTAPAASGSTRVMLSAMSTDGSCVTGKALLPTSDLQIMPRGRGEEQSSGEPAGRNIDLGEESVSRSPSSDIRASRLVSLSNYSRPGDCDDKWVCTHSGGSRRPVACRGHRRGLWRARSGPQAGAVTGRCDGDRPAQLPSVPAAPLPGSDGGAVPGRYCAADPGGSARSAERYSVARRGDRR